MNSSSKSFSDYDNIRDKGNVFTSTKSIKAKHPKNLFLGHFNVNSIRSKCVSIEQLIKRTFDIFLISETKIDDSFPNAQFKIESYKSFRKDRGAFGGGLLFYVNETLNCRSLERYLPNTIIEILPLELRLLNSKWLILGTYKPPSQNEPTYVPEIQKLLTYYCSSYDNILLLGHFNMSFSNKNRNDLCDMLELTHLIKDPTCFKISNPSCIDNFYTSKNTMFFNSSTVKTGISDHDILICTMLHSTFCKGPSKFIYYRYCNNYNKEQFENILKQRLVSSSNFEEFFDTFLATLNEHAPLKKKKVRYNHQAFMNKTLCKAMTKRSKLPYTFNKKRSSENWQNYRRHRNICSNILNSTKKTFFEALNINEITDNRKFWKTIKPFFTDKCKTTNKIILTEINETLNDNNKISNNFNEYFKCYQRHKSA